MPPATTRKDRTTVRAIMDLQEMGSRVKVRTPNIYATIKARQNDTCMSEMFIKV